MSTECGFDKAWVGKCKNDSPCSEHSHLKCHVCGNPATRECPHTAGLVCGVPLCNDCIGVSDPRKPHGFMGFGPHGHIKRPQGHSATYNKETDEIVCECGQKWPAADFWDQPDIHLIDMAGKVVGV